MQQYQLIVDKIRQETDSVILFHSAGGKDSIVLCDILAKSFKKVVCCYMYMVKDLEHLNRQIKWTLKKYPNVTFIQMPHFAKSCYEKYGDLKLQKNEKQRILNLENCIELARKATGIEWVCLGFKATDGLNRRVMLKTYEDGAIFRGGHKFFPLASYTNKWCLKYIEENNLIKPIDYGMARGVSSEFVPNNTGCLLWVREHYPKDYEKTVKEYPVVERYIYEYERYTAINKEKGSQVANQPESV